MDILGFARSLNGNGWATVNVNLRRTDFSIDADQHYEHAGYAVRCTQNHLGIRTVIHLDGKVIVNDTFPTWRDVLNKIDLLR